MEIWFGIARKPASPDAWLRCHLRPYQTRNCTAHTLSGVRWMQSVGCRKELTTQANILLLDCQCLELPGTNGHHIRVPLYESNYHQYLPFALSSTLSPTRPGSYSSHNVHVTTHLDPSPAPAALMTAAAASLPSNAPSHAWAAIRPIVDRVHTHVCGHSTFTNMHKILQCNGMLSHDDDVYLTSVV